MKQRRARSNHLHSEGGYDKRLFLLWTGIRFIPVLLIWWNVVVGYLLNYLLDGIDGDIFERIGMKRMKYQAYDKWVDMWFYYALVIYTSFYVEDFWMRMLLYGFFGWRVIGMIVFYYSRIERTLLFFPNIFSELLLGVILFPELMSNAILLMAVIGLCFVKEWWIHVAKFDLSNAVFAKRLNRA